MKVFRLFAIHFVVQSVLGKARDDQLWRRISLAFTDQLELTISNDEVLADTVSTTIQTYNTFLLGLQKTVKEQSAALGTNLALCTRATARKKQHTSLQQQALDAEHKDTW